MASDLLVRQSDEPLFHSCFFPFPFLLSWIVCFGWMGGVVAVGVHWRRSVSQNNAVPADECKVTGQ